MSDKNGDEDDRINDLTKQVRSLSIQVKKLKKQIDGLKGKNNATVPPSPQEQASSCIQIGDRVKLLNTLKKPKNWDDTHIWLQSEARKGTVSRLHGEKIYFTTDNGVDTWRLAKNVAISPK
jgi:hypothetical protein